MAKNNNSSEQMMAKLVQEMEKQGIRSEEDIKSFLNGVIGKNIGELNFGANEESKEDQAQDLIYEAWESSPKRAQQLILQAKELDPDNSDVYNYLGDLEATPEKAFEYYEQGLIAGEKKLGKKFIKENKGHFWLMIKTRPYMRSLFNTAKCLALLNQNEESAKRYFRILELNPGDNMGARYELFSVSLKINAFKIIEALLKEYPEEFSAHWTYNKVLYHIKKNEIKEAEQEWFIAINTNRHVPRYLLGKTKLPKKLPDYISIGYVDEAQCYVAENLNLWQQTEGGLDFIESRT